MERPWRQKGIFWEDRRYGEIVDTRKTEGRSKDVSNPWRTSNGKLFESLSVAKQHELETTSKYMFINDGYMQKQNQVKRNNLKVSHQHQTPTVITYSQLLMVKTQV